jgi:phosphohistidine swiveling domain-containing protein/ATP-dependent protease HslVU (ClpYQ) peptidase subunit
MSLLLRFTDSAATAAGHTGGKGANLALLTQRGFPVPPGFVVTAQAYRDFIAPGGAVLARVATLPFDDPARLRAESATLRAELAALPLPAALVAETRARLTDFPRDTAFSVRSSSTMEDLAGAAFAGQHDTFLNVAGADAVLEKVKACFLSLWHDRALAYRQRQGFDHLLAAMAVVVQRMAPCEVAGVGFSINPVSGDLGELVIDANFGLGESVVSGEGEVDHWELAKADGAVRRARIARKTTKVVAVAGGTAEARVPEADAARPCLDAAQLAEVAALLRRVERSYRFPQDIEWGLAGGQIFLLQSRPVTTIPARWTRDESAERFPNVITPLTWDFVDDGFHRSLAFSFRLMNYPPCHGKWFGMHGHYIYGNQNVVDLYLRRAPFEAGSVAELLAVIPRLREEFRWVQELPLLWSRELDYYLLKIGELMAEPLDGKSLREVWQFVLTVNEHGAQYFQPNIAISITHATLHHLLHRLLGMFAGAEADRLFDGLMAYCETKTGVINRELFELARMIRAEPALEKSLAGAASRDLIEGGALAGFPKVAERFGRFLRDHGHREVDFDMFHPTWREVPWVVLDNLRLILQTPMDELPAAKERELRVRAQQAELELFRRVPADLHFFFHEILRLTRIYTSLDDLEHYQTTRLALPMRRGLRELGARLVRRDVLDEPEDVFFARRQQLDDAIAAGTDAQWRELAAAVRRQKAAYAADRARTPEWTLGESTAATPAATEDFLTGLPGSPGVAEGPVFVARGAEDFARFPKGSVLVARTTNPTWTPLFYSAVAVVTESGGPLSHGAVTAREMRIPAVMGAQSCLRALQNGRRVRVEGGAGKVFLL